MSARLTRRLSATLLTAGLAALAAPAAAADDEKGGVWMAYTDFGWIARRHGITDRDAQFKMASGVIASITASATTR